MIKVKLTEKLQPETIKVPEKDDLVPSRKKREG